MPVDSEVRPDVPRAAAAEHAAVRAGAAPRVRALFAPDFGTGNPYQSNLAGALSARGIEVVSRGYGRVFPLLGAMKKHGGPPILHLHWTQTFLTRGGRRSVPWSCLLATRFFLELALLKLRGVKLVWTVHNLYDHERRVPVERTVNRLLYRLVDQVIVLCDTARQTVHDAWGIKGSLAGKTNVVLHGNYIDSYPGDVDRVQSRRELGIGADEVLFLFVGAIRGYKGVEDLIRAFRNLGAVHARLIVAGRPKTEAVQRAIARLAEGDDRIRLELRWVPEREVRVLLEAADAVVVPYRDTLGAGSPLLATSFGKAVVSSRVGCIPEIVDEANAELLYDAADPDGLARALDRALAIDLHAIGRRNRRRAEVTFAWEKIGKDTEAVYQRALGQDVRPR
jgi:glycosyltransferase involved in cell wall biosynthesis